MPIKVVRNSTAAVLHFNGGFHVGDHAVDSNADGLNMTQRFHVPTYKFAQSKDSGLRNSPVDLEGAQNPTTFGELCLKTGTPCTVKDTK